MSNSDRSSMNSQIPAIKATGAPKGNRMQYTTNTYTKQSITAVVGERFAAHTHVTIDWTNI